MATQAAITARNETNAELLQCARSWASYESASSVDVTYAPTTYTYYEAFTVDLTFGAADVYTSTDDIPVARGTVSIQ